MTDAVPVFVVVGNVNQGKSSVVAALSENAAIPIDSYPGTTVRSATYVFRVGDRELFRLIDTPGFQEPRRMLAWLRGRAADPGQRVAAVRDFVAEFEGGADFHDEVELLRPILDGAGVLYVVDGSARFQPQNEAEMEVLRWTGQPGMALINRTRDRDHGDEWRPVLEQFFNIVRSFDAHGASFADRVALLRGFGEIREAWRSPIDAAVAAMQQEWADRQRRCAARVAELLCDALTRVERQQVRTGDDEAAVASGLTERLRATLRQLETAARRDLAELFRHGEIEADEPEPFEVEAEDLFSERSWRLFGLTRAEMARNAAIAGAVGGGAIDLAVGGLSFLAGTLIGGAGGYAVGWFGGQSLARTWGSGSKLAQALFPGDTGRFVAIGPIRNQAFAWMLLDRALWYARAVASRSHARRDGLEDRRLGVVQDLDGERRAVIDKVLREIVKRAEAGREVRLPRDQLAAVLAEVTMPL